MDRQRAKPSGVLKQKTFDLRTILCGGASNMSVLDKRDCTCDLDLLLSMICKQREGGKF